MANNDNSSASILVAFALGAIAGAAVALLYAPATGEETRRRLADKARKGRENLASVVDRGREVVERGREAFEQVRKEIV